MGSCTCAQHAGNVLFCEVIQRKYLFLEYNSCKKLYTHVLQCLVVQSFSMLGLSRRCDHERHVSSRRLQLPSDCAPYTSSDPGTVKSTNRKSDVFADDSAHGVAHPGAKLSSLIAAVVVANRDTNDSANLAANPFTYAHTVFGPVLAAFVSTVACPHCFSHSSSEFSTDTPADDCANR